MKLRGFHRDGAWGTVPHLGALLAGLTLVLAPGAARAQELGLDLSGEALPDLRPGIAVVGVSADPEAASAAKNAAAGLVAAARKTGAFASVLTPEEVQQKLGDDYGDALRCTEVTCLDPIADSLGVERLVTAQLTMDGKKVQVHVVGFARNRAEVDSLDVEARSTGLQKKVASDSSPLVGKLVTTLAQLKVTTNLSGATVILGTRELGSGSLDKHVPAGKHTLRVSAPEHSLFESQIELEPGGKLEVEANLSELPPTPPVATTGTPGVTPLPPGVTASGGLWTRPGLYVALVGVAALGAGLALGASAQGVAARAQDTNGDGIVDITRAELLAAQGNAQLANVLMGAGAAVAAGGAIWFLLTPTPPAAPASPAVGQLGAPGWRLVVTGSF